jgi:hypothetical protein
MSLKTNTELEGKMYINVKHGKCLKPKFFSFKKCYSMFDASLVKSSNFLDNLIQIYVSYFVAL